MTEPNKPAKPPTPADEFFNEWRSLICPICEYPLDMQQKASGPILWLCPMCRKWFNQQLERV